MTTRTRRVVASHTLAAIGMGLPWPFLLVLVDGAGSELLLGLAGAARLAPYVALSWLSGRLADRRERAAIVRRSIEARVVLLAGCAVAMHAGAVPVAVVLATLAIVAGTPAYPALAAGMPRLAGSASARATSLLVTAEVSSFVVGPAIGGLLVGRAGAGVAAALGAVSCLAAGALFHGTRLPAPAALDVPAGAGRPEGLEPAGAATVIEELRSGAGGARPGARGVWSIVRADRSARHALVVVATVNAAGSAIALALIELAEHVWQTGEEGFGLATAVLGLGALAAPLLSATRPMTTARGCLFVLAGSVAAIGLLPVPGSLVALAAVGALSTCCENVATGVIQASVPDERRASVLGLADSLMIGAALLAALTAPWLAGLLGAIPFVLAVAAGTAALAASQGNRGRVRGIPGHGGEARSGGMATGRQAWERALP